METAEAITVDNAVDMAEFKRVKRAAEEGKTIMRENRDQPKEKQSEPNGGSESVSETGETKIQEQQPKKKERSAEARFSELTAKRKEAEERARLAEERATRAERELQESRTRKPEAAPEAKPAEKPKDDDPKPTFQMYSADAKSYEEAQEKYQDALYDWRKRQEQKANDLKSAETRSAEAKQKIRNAVEQAKQKHPNFSEEGGKISLPFSPQGWENFFGGKDFDHPIEVLQHLHAHPDEYARLLELSKSNAARFVAELMFIDRNSGKAPETPKPQPASRVGAPPKTLSGHSPAPAGNLNEATSMSEFKAMKRAGAA